MWKENSSSTETVCDYWKHSETVDSWDTAENKIFKIKNFYAIFKLFTRGTVQSK